MNVDVLVAEIGSTTTVVNAFTDLDTDHPCFWGQGQAPTSVLDGDVRVGLQGAVDDLCKNKGISSIEYGQMLATSSAAGGLKMTVHGLVYDMTAKAAKEAALGAGGIIHYVTSGRLRRTDLKKIREIQPNLILIAGGVDYGERDTALDNAEMIRGMGLKVPVIYAGNVENQEEIKLIFEDSEQELYIVENVYPKIDALNVEPCRKVIQQAFEQHITHAPGMEHVRDMVSGPIIPTPGAVMECTKVLYDCIGDLIVLDVGGATTDLHSVAVESDKVARIMTSPEPKAKRTVEGDLGVFVNRYKVIESIGEEKLREECENELHIDLDKTLETYYAIPKNEDEIKLVERLTREAVFRATERHAGQLRYIYGPSGRSTVAEGKDLTQVKYIVGTGGALTRLPHRVEIMEEIPGENITGMRLFPTDHAKVLVDNDYIMASLGVLSKTNREAAIKLLEKSLDFEFPEKVENEIYKSSIKAMEDVEAEYEAKKKKEEEYAEHIREMEEMGYDMSAYKEEEPIGGANARGPEGSHHDPAKEGIEAGSGLQPGWNREKQEDTSKPWNNCNRECDICTHTHCPNNQSRR
ncbi:GlmL-related ornithine degradation protein [Hornefia butyriciproducens]|uniref:GlmL-related ornithine degradation protein n=1 Tax=Hornefia butyriciproducens TaxID=2652293 RepID=UPI00389AF8F3